jgi:hypothetical protein
LREGRRDSHVDNDPTPDVTNYSHRLMAASAVVR